MVFISFKSLKNYERCSEFFAAVHATAGRWPPQFLSSINGLPTSSILSFHLHWGVLHHLLILSVLRINYTETFKTHVTNWWEVGLLRVQSRKRPTLPVSTILGLIRGQWDPRGFSLFIWVPRTGSVVQSSYMAPCWHHVGTPQVFQWWYCGTLLLTTRYSHCLSAGAIYSNWKLHITEFMYHLSVNVMRLLFLFITNIYFIL